MNSISNNDTTAPILVPVEVAGKMLGIGRTSVFGLIKTNDMETAKIGSRRLVYVESIRALAERARANQV
ncbi:MerR family transcriptional regulator [Pararhodospirillum oryzae]|uniref:Helix-turn-helix domain-containing protein n=1 Tax=Pararhodospirillum oryzae TaxID=478448 RepID=A0A512H4C5_9PROT|nr:helix-turn-helix domain-containing protein [Pararhodospirillum oryzae]GEO80281.1 hypothetical protein ROR02_04120 [Pararhodospirillum oryzae]